MDKHKEQRLRNERRLGSVQGERAPEGAKEAFQRPAYQTYTVQDVLRRWGVNTDGRVADGQTNAQAVQSIAAGTETE